MAMGVTEVWVCADGTNDDCDSQNNEYAEQGKNKSGTNKNIFGIMRVVNAKDGLPIYSRMYRGSRHDSKEIFEVIDHIRAYGLTVHGIILDRGFATVENMRKIREAHYAFIIFLKEGNFAQKTLYSKYASKIRMSYEYSVDDEGILFGVVSSEEIQVFHKHKDTAYVGLFYDSKNGNDRARYLIKKIRKGEKEARKAIAAGNEPTIPSDISEYLKKHYVEETKEWVLSVELEKIHSAVDKKGFSSIACSEKMGAEELNWTYHLRDHSEKDYSINKSQCGNHVSRVHSTESSEAKTTIGFITSIYRHKFMMISREMGMNTNVLIKELEQIRIFHIRSNAYIYSHTASNLQLEILSRLGITQDTLEELTKEENQNVPERHPRRKLPAAPAEKPHIGRPKGSRNKKTIAREKAAARASVNPIPSSQEKDKPAKPKAVGATPKRGRGRPPGSKNKKTIEREKAEAVLREQGLLPPKRKPGRPLGSKNKKGTIASRKEAPSQK